MARSVNNAAPPCFCAIRFATRTASGIATGAWSRTSASRAEALCRSMCCIWARSTTRRNWRGAARSSVGRGCGSTQDPVAVSRRSLRRSAAGRLDRSVEALAASPLSAAPMGRVLAGADVVGRVATRSVLGRASAGEPQGDALGSGTVRAGRLSPAGARQRVAAASGMVRTDRAGRSVGRRLRAGRDPQALSLPRPAAGTQTSAVRSSERAAGATCSTPASISCSTI